MKITALAGGIGGARFVRGLKAHLAAPSTDDPRSPHDPSSPQEPDITVIGNTGDDIWVHGLRVCPDLDTVMYTLGGGISAERGWGREGETFTVKDELAAYGVEPTWFGLGDKDIATHLIRTASLRAGYPLSDVTAALCERWQPGVRLLPMTDDRAETHVVIADDATQPGSTRAIHFQEWWIKHRAAIAAREFVVIGIDDASPAPGVIEAIESADVVVLPPSNPIVSIGTILQVRGIREALLATKAPVVGVSPIIGTAPVRGMADACLAAVGVETSALGVARHYGSRRDGGILDAWLVADSDSSTVADIEALGIRCASAPLLMTDVPATAAMASSALDLVL